MNVNPTQQSILNKQREDKFLLVFQVPPILQAYIKETKSNNIFSINQDTVQFTVFGAITPEVQVPPETIPFSGQSYNISSHTRPNWPPLTIRYYIDNEFNNYWLFWKWLAILNDPKEGWYNHGDSSLATPLNSNMDITLGLNLPYQTNLSIFVLNEYNQRVVEFVYRYAHATTLGAIDWNYQNSGEVVGSTTFVYNQLVMNKLSIQNQRADI